MVCTEIYNEALTLSGVDSKCLGIPDNSDWMKEAVQYAFNILFSRMIDRN